MSNGPTNNPIPVTLICPNSQHPEYEYKPDIEIPYTSDDNPDDEAVARMVSIQESDGWSLHYRLRSPNRHGDGRNYEVLKFCKPKT